MAIFGRALFWPTHPAAGQATTGSWGRVATRVVRRPLVVLIAGLVLFGAPAAGLFGFTTGGFISSVPAASDSAAGSAALAAHFPAANSSPESLLLRFATPIWGHPESVSMAEDQLGNASNPRSVSGPLNPNGTTLSLDELVSLHAQLGPAATLPATPPPSTSVTVSTYQAYRATAQFISADGRTVQFYALAAAGPAGSQAAITSIPAMRSTLDSVAHSVGAEDEGVFGLDAVAYDINDYSTRDLVAIAPVVMLALAVLLALLLRSLIAPLYSLPPSACPTSRRWEQRPLSFFMWQVTRGSTS
jgi:RND superfamily putative drug exporter